MIPDISGFTDFVSTVALEHSQHIIAELLELLLRENRLGLTCAEVEGDALLFYRHGPPPPFEALRSQAEHWHTRFHEHLQVLRRQTFCTCGACQNLGALGLKVVMHHGDVGIHRIGRTERLIGRDVILAHRMLKNSLGLREYLLLSDGLARATRAGSQSPLLPHREAYPVLGETLLAYQDLAPLRARVQSAADEAPALPGTVAAAGEAVIRAPLPRIVEALTDHAQWWDWMAGLEALEVDPTAPQRQGQTHLCVVDGNRLLEALQELSHTREEMWIVYRVRPPMPLIRELYRATHCRVEAGGVRVRIEMRLRAVPGTGWLVRRRVRSAMASLLQRSTEHLRERLEASPTRPDASPAPGSATVSDRA